MLLQRRARRGASEKYLTRVSQNLDARKVPSVRDFTLDCWAKMQMHTLQTGPCDKQGMAPLRAAGHDMPRRGYDQGRRVVDP